MAVYVDPGGLAAIWGAAARLAAGGAGLELELESKAGERVGAGMRWIMQT